MPATDEATLDLKRSPFHDFHLDHHARLVEFAGWELPLLYTSILEEHRQVRQVGGMFDVSHMGRLSFSGRAARRLLERTLSRRVSDMREHTCRYSMVCNEQGGVLDDVLIYRYEDHWLLVVNALNRQKLREHFTAQGGDLNVKIEDRTESTAMVALQGPEVMERLGEFSSEIAGLKRFNFVRKNLMMANMTISRTGYTGEDGVEIILPAKLAPMAVKMLMKDENASFAPCGLGARDTLRLEAGLPLYGHELDERTDPLSAGLDFAVSLDKDEHEQGEPFIGQQALRRIHAEGPTRRLMGMTLEGRRTPRQGAAVRLDGEEVGTITSGCLSPSLEYPIALAYVRSDVAEVDRLVRVQIGSREGEARLVQRPFYKRGR